MNASAIRLKATGAGDGKTTKLIRSKCLYPVSMFFREQVPMALRNAVSQSRSPSMSEADMCIQEIHSFFTCLRKWDFDDSHCRQEHSRFIACTDIAETKAREAKARTKLGDVVAGARGRLTSDQLNRLLAKYPQPNLGAYPYRYGKRLPSQSYADDDFDRKRSNGSGS